MSTGIALLINARDRDLGGFSVGRVLPYAKRRLVGPFIFFDHMGPADFGPGTGIDVRPHPHIGLATVTYLFEGAMVHRDSLGYVQKISPGDVNWMTAGCGVVHSERTGAEERATGQRMHGIQSWAALPNASAEIDPGFVHRPHMSLPVIDIDGISMRLVAGTAFGSVSPVTTCSPTFYLDADMPVETAFTLPPEHEERALYVVDGAVTVDGEPVANRQMAILTAGTAVEIRATMATRLMLLGGAAMDGPRLIYWNFVAATKKRIDQAKDDWQNGRFDGVPGDMEFTPLPEA